MNSITVCTDGGDMECWQSHESIWHGTIRLFVSVAHFELLVLLSDSFTVVPKSWAYVVRSTKCFVLKWETACTFSTCVVSSFLYLDTNFVDILFLVPQCYLFRRRNFFAYFKTLIKISKGFKKRNCRNCFRKTGFYELFFLLKKFSIVRTPTSVTKMISRK